MLRIAAHHHLLRPDDRDVLQKTGIDEAGTITRLCSRFRR
jgi:hypothetical protein